jgi:hypothetical protein
MPQKHIESAAMALNSRRRTAMELVQRAASERERSVNAANEVVASVHESLAVRYAAQACSRPVSKPT